MMKNMNKEKESPQAGYALACGGDPLDVFEMVAVGENLTSSMVGT